MILLQNANLPAFPFNNMICLLVASAKEGSNTDQIIFNLHSAELSELQEDLASLKKEWREYFQMVAPLDINSEETVSKGVNINKLLTSQMRNVSDIRTGGRNGKYRIPYVITLDDAVEALK